MTILKEGRLTFTFNAGCSARRYDKWAFYRNQFQNICGGAKAVDFICIERNDLWLIEVKDYRRSDTKEVVDLHKAVAQKFRDTLAGIVTAKYNANDRGEKEFAENSLSTCRLHLVLHIEQSANVSRFFPRAVDPADLKQKLKSWLKAIDAYPKIVDQHTLKANMPWTVTG